MEGLHMSSLWIGVIVCVCLANKLSRERKVMFSGQSLCICWQEISLYKHGSELWLCSIFLVWGGSLAHCACHTWIEILSHGFFLLFFNFCLFYRFIVGCLAYIRKWLVSFTTSSPAMTLTHATPILRSRPESLCCTCLSLASSWKHYHSSMTSQVKIRSYLEHTVLSNVFGFMSNFMSSQQHSYQISLDLNSWEWGMNHRGTE